MNREPQIDPAALGAAWDQLLETGRTSRRELTALHLPDQTLGPAQSYLEHLRRNLLKVAFAMTESNTSFTP